MVESSCQAASGCEIIWSEDWGWKDLRNRRHLRKTKEPACTGDNPKPIHMPPKSQLFKSTTSSKSTASPPKISAPLEVQPPKEPHETACSKKPKKSSYPVDVPEQLLAPKPPVDRPVTRSGCTPRPPSHLKDLVVTKWHCLLFVRTQRTLDTFDKFASFIFVCHCD